MAAANSEKPSRRSWRRIAFWGGVCTALFSVSLTAFSPQLERAGGHVERWVGQRLDGHMGFEYETRKDDLAAQCALPEVTKIERNTFRGDSTRSGEQPGPGLRGQPTECWAIRLPEIFEGRFPSVADPILANGVLYVSDRFKTLYAFDALSGAERWRFETGDYNTSVPTVYDGVLYVGSGDGNIYSLDASTGELRWHNYFYMEGVMCSPVIRGDLVITANNVAVYALDQDTGKVVWRVSVDGPSCPANFSSSVYVLSLEDGYLTALRYRDGEEIWRFPTLGARSDAFDDVPIGSPGHTVAAVGQSVYFDDGLAVYAVDVSTGSERWVLQFDDGVASVPAVSNGRIYVEAGSQIRALDGHTGDELWRLPSLASSSPTVIDNTVYFGRGAELVAADVISGEISWAMPTRGTVSTSPLIAGGRVYAGTNEGYLYAFGVAER